MMIRLRSIIFPLGFWELALLLASQIYPCCHLLSFFELLCSVNSKNYSLFLHMFNRCTCTLTSNQSQSAEYCVSSLILLLVSVEEKCSVDCAEMALTVSFVYRGYCVSLPFSLLRRPEERENAFCIPQKHFLNQRSKEALEICVREKGRNN